MALFGCEAPPHAASNEATTAAPPPLVAVMTVRRERVPIVVELPGRIRPIRSAEVRARVDGIVERRFYHEGTDLVAGTPLFQIDPRDLAAQAEQAKAVLRRAEARHANARQIVQRYRPLLLDRSVSELEFDRANATLQEAEAEVAEASAALARARLQLGYTTVRAPLSGRVGSAKVTEGALVSASAATLMTTVEQLSPVYAIFPYSRSEVLRLLNAGHARTIVPSRASNIEVSLVLEDGRAHDTRGRLDFTDEAVDAETGSQTLRAVFANPRHILLPGQFVRVRVHLGTVPDGVLVPIEAVQIEERGARIAVVASDGRIAHRTVELGSQHGTNWVVLTGLKDGEKIVAEGWQKARPGQKVRVQDFQRASPSAIAGR